MKYRARYTFAVRFIDSYYNLNKYIRLRDKFELWIEVDSPKEAELIEQLNKREREVKIAKLSLIDYLQKNKKLN